MKNILNAFLKALFPENITCIFCGDELNADNNIHACNACTKNIKFITSNKCIRCGMPLPVGYATVCKNCKSHNYDFDAVRSAVVYDDKVKDCIYKFKYSDAAYLGKYLASYLVPVYACLDWNIDIVIAVPLHKNRQKSRGYNQSEILAKHFCEATKLNILDAIERITDTPSQTLLTHIERTKNLKDAFKIKKEYLSDIKDKNILIIDDVYTTGATIQEITRLLKRNGARKVYGLTVAHAIYHDNIN